MPSSSLDFQTIFSTLMQTEEAILPIFIHNPQSKAIVGAIMVTETVFSQLINGMVSQPLITKLPETK